MRRRCPTCLLVCLLLPLALSACQRDPGRPGPDAGSVPPSPPAYGKVFLDRGECGSGGADPREVRCGSPGAVARVLVRQDAGPARGPACPAATDFVLRISEDRPAAGEDGAVAVARGYACMRNLRPPHPGDPGAGGGPITVVGDCVRNSAQGQVKEVACAGSDGGQPDFKVASAVAKRSQCPRSTALFVRVGGDRPVGCARRL